MAAGALARIRTVFFDLDGVLWFGTELAPHAAELVRTLRDTGRQVCFVSNVTSSTAAMVAERLESLGIAARAEEVQTPFSILADHPLLADDPPIFLLGNAAIRRVLVDAGFNLTDDPEVSRLVIVSRDTGMCYADLAAAAQALYSGATLLAMNLDMRVPMDGGQLVPGNGAIVAALTAATGVRPAAVGKPDPFYFERALARFGAAPETTVMVGDNLDSDIAGGNRAGLVTVQVGGDGYTLLDEPPVPDYRVADLFELERLLLG